MKSIRNIRIFILLPFVLITIFGFENYTKDGLIRVLILSGKSDHDWKKTTPVLVKLYEDSRLFSVDITEMPDTLVYSDLRSYDVVVSNWNTWPDSGFRMTKEWENDFVKYVKSGGGVVFIHAGASSFYNWEEYHKIGIGRLGKQTVIGKPVKGKVFGFDLSHPVTKGFKDFYIMDEVWEKTDIHPEARSLASVNAEKDGKDFSVPAIFVKDYGKGHCFYTVLGHNGRALVNSGLQTILLRASEWAAHRRVTTMLPIDLKEKQDIVEKNFSWEKSDTSFSLMNNSDILWQFNFNNRFGKPYFHPVTTNNSLLTCESPPTEHAWHLGLWYSWKYINGVNYWEYAKNYKSEGTTEVKKINFRENDDFSAEISTDLQFYPEGAKAVLAETHNIHVSPPYDDGSYYIDYHIISSPMIDEVVLDRTPILGEPDGKVWGGYAGLNVRFNQDFTSPEIITPVDNENYQKENWLYMGFNTLTGDTAGICIIKNPKFSTPATSWYIVNDPALPFYYYSPCVLYDNKIILKKGESLQLKYRVWVIPGKTSKEEMQLKNDQFLNN